MFRGSTHPVLGWTSPYYRHFVPRWTVRLESAGRNLDYATTISLDPRRLEASIERVGSRSLKLSLNSHGTPVGTLSVRRHGSDLTVSRSP
jgi:hypothetical protein